MHLYNDNDPKCCAWMRELILAKLLPPGNILCESIAEITPEDVKPYTQFHTFAGIGGWPHALRLAGWPTGRPIWTASLPCQPFSTAGKQKGIADERHLWPVFFNLVRKCRPECIVGEQVEAAVRLGWLDGVSSDLEREGYTFGFVVLGAHSAGAPHIRQRIYWVAVATGDGCKVRKPLHAELQGPGFVEGCSIGRLADSPLERRDGSAGMRGPRGRPKFETNGAVVGVAFPDGQQIEPTDPRGFHAESGGSRRLGFTQQQRLEGLAGHGDDGHQSRRIAPQPNGPVTATGPTGFWDDYEILPCRDGKYRRTQSGLFPLAHGFPCRVGILRGSGNAIVAPLAAAFLQTVMEEIYPHAQIT